MKLLPARVCLPVIVIPEEPPSFNAAVTGAGYDTMVMKLVLLGLTRIDPAGNVYPVLAAELPTQANGDVTVDEQAGAMQVTWHMRPDVVWSDGQPVTAADVLFTWDALKDPHKGIYVKGSDVVDHLEKVDDHTVTVFYSAIYPDYLTQLGGDTLAIWPKYDPNAAKALLELAGWIDSNNDGVRECHGCQNAAEGAPMEMEFLTYSEAGEALHLTQQVVAESLGQIGFKLNQSTIEGSVMWADSGSGGVEQTGNFDMDLWDYGYSGRDPVEFIRSLYAAGAAEPDQGWNVGRWINPDFDALLAQAYTLDETKRQAALCHMAKLLDDQVPEVLLVTTINADGYSPRLQGIQATDNDVGTWNVADWRVTQ